MMRALIAAIVLVIAAGAAGPHTGAALALPRVVLEPAPAATPLILLAAQGKPTVNKRCGSRGGFRRTRSYYATPC